MSNAQDPSGSPAPFRATSFPWRLYSGPGALDNLPAEVTRQRARRAFVICGQTVAHRTNLLQRVRDGLGELYGGAFDRMDKDSSYPAVLAATEAARVAGTDLIVAVGGGSAIVGARAVAILLAEKGSAYELMTQYPEGKPPVSPKLLAPKIPIINVPTTPTSAMNRAGTGLKDDTLDHRMEFFDPKTRPVALFWDAEALLTAPLSLARSTGTTTFTGCLQSVAAGAANPLVEGDHRQAFQLARRALPRMVAEPGDAGPRIELCAAAFLQNRAADDGAAREGRDQVSSAAYAFATALHIRYDHIGQGESTSSVTPGVMRRLGAARGDGARRMAEALGVSTEGMAPEAAAAAAADALDAFYRRIGMPSRVRDLEIPEADLPLLARDTLKNFNANPGDRPADYADRMLDLLRACW
ncbi:MAG TPA: iron-containing alcohol dehydrogenase family protein [Candidatus Limnocylindrales bacterium]|nr:iron-containing alcohol dehydrogenase family protein [Candidatus Limnocylindrales bacterium]